MADPSIKVTRFRDDGYLAPIDVLTAAEAARYRGLVEHTLADNERGRVLRHKGHLVLTWLDALIRHPDILAAVGSLLGRNLLCWTVNLFYKGPRDPGFVSWHQDATYWGLRPPDVLTAWVALSPSGSDNGCMRVVPSSHGAQLRHVDRPDAHNLLTRGQHVDAAVDELARDVVLAPGQMSLHHVLLIHGSRPNMSDEPRIGIAIRYLAPHVRQVSGRRDSASLVSGVDTHGHFEPEPRPRADFDPAALAYYQHAVPRHLALLMADEGRPAG